MGKLEEEVSNYYRDEHPFWDKIPSPITKILRAQTSFIPVKKGENLFNEGFIPKGVYIIRQGILKLFVIDAAGREQIIFMFKKNEIFGYQNIITENSNLYFVTAITDCEVELIEKDVFLTMMKESSELNDYFMKKFGEELNTMVHKIIFFAQKPVNERVALTLLALNQKFNEPGKKSKGVYFSRKDVANCSGTIIETLSRQLKILSKEKIVKVDGRNIFILDKERLFKIANI